MMFLRNVSATVDAIPISLQAAQKAIGNTIALYSRMPPSYWKLLAELELSQNQTIDITNDDIKNMLPQLSVLEYRNGCKTDDIFVSNAPWYAVHPIVRELRSFKDAVNDLKVEREKQDGSGFSIS
jgi:hypothetical protein